MQDVVCELCKLELESVDHLMLNCSMSNLVWRKVHGWLGFQVPLPATFEELYWLHKGFFKKKKGNRRGLVVWHAVIWTIWLERNAAIFSTNSFDLLRMPDLIKHRSWSWLTAEKEWKYSFAAWCSNPGKHSFGRLFRCRDDYREILCVREFFLL